MKRFYFILILISIFISQSVYGQENWPRTFSGIKDAIVHTYVDENDGIVYAIGSNGYDNLPVQSAEEPNLSNFFIGTTTGIGQCLIKFDKYGNTIGYKKLGTQNGVDTRAKVYMTNTNELIALSGSTVYKINPSTLTTLGTYTAPFGNSSIESIELVTSDTNMQFLVVQTRNTISYSNFNMTFTLHNLNNFQILDTVTFTFNNLEHNGFKNGISNKLLTLDNEFVIFGIHAQPKPNMANGTISVDVNGFNQTFIINNPGTFYLFNMQITFGSIPSFLYTSEVENRDIYDFDVANEKIYAVGRSMILPYDTSFIPDLPINSEFEIMTRYRIFQGSHYFYSEIDKKIIKLNAIGILEWALGTDTFEPFYIEPTISYGTMVSGWYERESILPNAILPDYGSLEGRNSAIARIIENNNSPVYSKSVPKAINITLFPNPATDLITLQTTYNITGKIKIIDYFGNVKLTIEKPVDINGFKFNIERFSAGTYYILIETENEQQKLTFVVK